MENQTPISKPETAAQTEGVVGVDVPPLVLPSSGELLGSWYESSAYGDHVPKELPDLMIAFLKGHGVTIDEGAAWDIIMESGYSDPWTNLFECIFAEGAEYTMRTLENQDLLRENAESIRARVDSEPT